MKETTTTPKPYFCGQDVVRLLLLPRPPFNLQKLLWVTARLQGVLGGFWELESLKDGSLALAKRMITDFKARHA